MKSGIGAGDISHKTLTKSLNSLSMNFHVKIKIIAILSTFFLRTE